jgi:hypothetical protein
MSPGHITQRHYNITYSDPMVNPHATALHEPFIASPGTTPTPSRPNSPFAVCASCLTRRHLSLEGVDLKLQRTKDQAAFLQVFSMCYFVERKHGGHQAAEIILDAFVAAWFYRYPQVEKLWKTEDKKNQDEFRLVRLLQICSSSNSSAKYFLDVN